MKPIAFKSNGRRVSFKRAVRTKGWVRPDRTEFFKLLKARQMTIEKIAKEIGSSHSRVSQAINEVPGRGRFLRARIQRVLTPEELRALGWSQSNERKGE